MVKIVRITLALFAALLFTTPSINSNVSGAKIKLSPTYYKPLEFNVISYSNNDIECLAQNIYFEARAESTAGKLAVQSIELFLMIILITFVEWSKKEDIIIVQNRKHGNHLEICASFRGTVTEREMNRIQAERGILHKNLQKKY